MLKILTIPLALWAVPALAQTVEPPPVADSEDQSQMVQIATGESDFDGAQRSDIVVTAPSLRGQVDTAESPIATLNEADIQATGAGSIAELLTRISPQTGSGRGRGGGGGMPVVLVNGQRVTNFRELRNFPPDRKSVV